MGNVYTVGPNKAMVVPGGCFGLQRLRMVVGGWAWSFSSPSTIQYLSLEVMTLYPECEDVETALGVQLSVSAVALVKIISEKELLWVACEQLLGKTVDEIKLSVVLTLEGHLRAILGKLTVEEVYKDRDLFASLVREVAAPDVLRMGIEILSFTIKDIKDDVEYLSSLGKAQTAIVMRDAAIGVALSDRDAGIRVSQCERDSLDVEYSTKTKIENSMRSFILQKAQFNQEVNTANAKATLAYELQSSKIKQQLRNEEKQIDVVERQKQIEIEDQEILRREEELKTTVRLPAEAEAYSLLTIAEGIRTGTIESAKADAEYMKIVGLAEAEAARLVGCAAADQLLARANAYKLYGDAAVRLRVLETLPKVR
ncbi:hypothetical protein ACJJTC_006003 [Scirpophaga incertulas]